MRRQEQRVRDIRPTFRRMPAMADQEGRYGVFLHDAAGWRLLAFVGVDVARAMVVGATCRLVAMEEVAGTWSVIYASHPALDGGRKPEAVA